MPIVQICLAFLIGILLSEFLLLETIWFPISSLLLLIVMYWQNRKRISKAWEWGFTFALLLSCILLGNGYGTIHRMHPGNHVIGLGGRKLNMEVRVVGEEKSTPYGKKAIVQCIQSLDLEMPIQGKVLIYYDNQDQELHIGDILHASFALKPLQCKHPGYQKYLENQGIFITAKSKEIEIVGHEWSLIGGAMAERKRIKETIQSHMPDNQISGLAVAMLLGDKSGLSPELKAQFRKSGLSHILAISGLHVGIVFVFLNSFLSFLDRLPAGKLIRTFLVIFLLTGFALMTGGSSSVCRAVLMIAFISLGKVLFRQTNGINLLAVVALLLLIIDPTNLFRIGFQLSFCAVTGILLLTPILNERIKARFPMIGKGFAESISICLSAQAFTSPLVFYHFGSFPTYFLLANVLLLPIVAYTVNLGVIAVLLAWIPGLNSALFGMLDFCLWTIAAFSSQIGNLPGSEMVKISFYDSGFRALLVISIATFLIWNSPRIFNWFRKPDQSYLSFRHGAKQTG